MKRMFLKIAVVSTLVIIIFICNISNNSNNSTSSGLSTKSKKQLTQNEKLQDFEYLYTILKNNYPFFKVNKRINGIDWLRNRNKYINKIKSTKNDEDFYKALSSILSELHNGHTEILNKQEYFYFKALYENDVPWANQLNDSKAADRYMQVNDSQKSTSMTLQSGNGVRCDAKITNLANKYRKNSDNIEQNNVAAKVLINKNKIAYLKIKSFNNFNVKEDMKIIKPFLHSIKKFKKLIIDIRGNGGGTDAYWSDNIVPMLINKPLNLKYYFAYRGGSFEKDFINYKLGFDYAELKPMKLITNEKLKNSPPELNRDFKYYYKYEETINPINSINFKGKIYLLIDGGVGSSADGFASFAKNTGFATLIGEKTFGGGIGQDPLVCVMPNSGYIFRFPMVMGLASDGTCNEEYKTIPNVEVPQQWYRNIFKDKSIQYVLTGKNEIITIPKIFGLILILVLCSVIIYFRLRLKLTIKIINNK